MGTIRTVKPWLFLDRFVFHNSNGDAAKALLYFKFHARSHLTLNVYFNSLEDRSYSRSDDRNWDNAREAAPDGTNDGGMSQENVALFKDVYQSDQSCMWRDRQSRRWGNSFDINEWWTHSSDSGKGIPIVGDEQGTADLGWVPRQRPTPVNHTSKEWRYASMELTVQSSSPKWFYMVLANCLKSKDITKEESTTGISSDPDYSVVRNQELVCSLKNNGFCQGPLDNVWYEFKFINGKSHVSYDNEGMFGGRLIMSIIYGVLFCIVFLFVGRLSRLKKLHHTAKILLFSVFVSLLGHIFGAAHWDFLNKGQVRDVNIVGVLPLMEQNQQHQWARNVALFLDLLSHITTVILLILIAKGWTITRRKISAMGRVRLSIYATLYASLYIYALLWWINEDPALVTFMYESPPGRLIQSIRFISSFWFLYACWTTFRSNPQKRSFYKIFTLFFFLWFISVPFLTMICSTYVALTSRGQAMFYIEHVNILIGHFILTVLWTPSNFDRIFPFFENRMHTNVGSQSSSHVQSLGNNRMSLSGGSTTFNNPGTVNGAAGVPADTMNSNQKALYIAASLKYRLMMMQDQTDDLVDAITQLNEETEIDLLRTMAAEAASSSSSPSSSSSVVTQRGDATQNDNNRSTITNSHHNINDNTNNSGGGGGGSSSSKGNVMSSVPVANANGMIRSSVKNERGSDTRGEEPQQPRSSPFRSNGGNDDDDNRGDNRPNIAPPKSRKPNGGTPGSNARRMLAQSKMRSGDLRPI